MSGRFFYETRLGDATGRDMVIRYRKTVLNDFGAFVSIVLVGVALVMAVVSLATGYTVSKTRGLVRVEGADQVVLQVVLAVMMLAGFVGHVARVAWLERFVTKAAECQGVVTGLSLYRDRGHVQYSYEVDGERRSAKNAVHASAQVRALAEGQAVRVLAGAKGGKQRSLIKDLYV